MSFYSQETRVEKKARKLGANALLHAAGEKKNLLPMKSILLRVT